mmetsp:Transcript_58774/g.120228  ORF Transcript_58774/g.120228 Transcript_58774/m.120228 type:complete len:736 (-) Transcript_58774:538-2745(-)
MLVGTGGAEGQFIVALDALVGRVEHHLGLPHCRHELAVGGVHLEVARLQPLVGDLLPLGVRDVSVADDFAAGVSVVGSADVSNTLSVVPDGLPLVQGQVALQRQTDKALAHAVLLLRLQCLAPAEVHVRLQLHGPAQASLQGRVVHAHVLVPVLVALLDAHGVDGAVAGVRQVVLLALAEQLLVHLGAGLLGDVQLEPQLAHKSEADHPHRVVVPTVRADGQVLRGGEGEILQCHLVLLQHQLAQQGVGQRSLQTQQTVVLRLVPQGAVEALLLDDLADPVEVVRGRASPRSDVEPVRSQFGDRQVRHDAALGVAHLCVDRGAVWLAHVVGAQEVHGSLCVRPLEEELAEVALVEHCAVLSARGDFLGHHHVAVRPLEGVFPMYDVAVAVVLVRLVPIVPVKVIRSHRRVLDEGLCGEKPGTLPVVARLEDALGPLHLLVEGVKAAVAAGHGLVTGEGDGVVLGVGLVAGLLDPLLVPVEVRVEALHIVAEHVQRGVSLRHPVRQLPARTARQHDAVRVEPCAQEEAPAARHLAHQRLVVRSEGLGPAHSMLDLRLGDGAHPVDRPVDVAGEGVPVQLEQAKVEVRVNFIPEIRVLLVAANLQDLALLLEVDRGVVVAHVGRAFHPRDLARDYVRVLHGAQRSAHAHHGRDGGRPHTAAVEHLLGLDHVPLGGHHRLHALDPVDRGGVDVCHGGLGENLGAVHLGALGQRRDPVGRVDGAVALAVQGAEDVVHID